MDTTSHYMKDQAHVTQCFKCQSYGHENGSPYCPLTKTDKPTCLYCADEHESRKCQLKADPTKHKCSNCLKTKKYQYTANHITTSPKCPIYNKELDAIIKRTAVDSKNYPIQRVIDHQ